MFRRVATAVLLSVAAVPAPLLAQSNQSALAEQDIAIWGRVLAMTDARKPDSALLVGALASTNPRLRAFAALATGQVHAANFAPTLRALLQDADTGVAAQAAYSLGLLRDGAGVAALARALDMPGPVAVEAAWSLGTIADSLRRRNDPEAVQWRDSLRVAMLRKLVSPPRNPRALHALLLASTKLAPVPVAELLPHLRSTDSATVWRAAYAVSRNRPPSALRALLPLAQSPFAMARAQVARAFALPAVGDSLMGTALETLPTLARDSDAQVRVNAVTSLASFGARGAAAVRLAARDPDGNVRITAASSAARTILMDTTAWVEMWRADTSFTYRRTLLAAAVPRALLLDQHSAWRADSSARRRTAAAELSSSLSAVAMREAVAVFQKDRDAKVRRAAFSVVSMRMDSFPDARALLWSGLSDDDPAVRTVIVNALARAATGAEVARVLALRQAWREDSIPDARAAALRFVAAAIRRDSTALPDDVSAQIASIMLPADAAEIRASQGIPQLAGWPQPSTGTNLPGAAWYVELVRKYVVPSLAGRNPRVSMQTERGSIELELFAADAPLTVNSFLTLAQSGYHNGARFHRVVPNFVVQDGEGTGSGGPGYTLRDELNRHRHERGVLSMAHSGPDTGGAQYFITHSPQPHLDGLHTVFGRVQSGLPVLDAILQGDLLLRLIVR